MNDLKILLYMDLLKVKNKVKEIFTTPKLLIKYILGILYFVGMGSLFLLGGHSDGDAPMLITHNINLAFKGVLAIISIIILLIVFAYYLSSYTPSNFTISDVQYLFPSSINNKLLLLYSLIKTSFLKVLSTIVSVIFIFILLCNGFKLSYNCVFSVLLGIFLFYILFMSLAYLIFSVRVKFKLDKLFKILSYIAQGLLAVFVLLIIFILYKYDFNTYEAFKHFGNSPILYIPLIVNIVNIISLIFGGNIYPIVFDYLVLISLSTIFCFIFLKMKINYYEYIAEKVEEKDLKIKEIKKSKDITWNSQLEKNIKKVDINKKSKEFTGVLSLYWKNSTIRKRRNSSVKKYLIYILNIGIAACGAYATLEGFQKESILAISIVTIYGSMIFSGSCELGRELKNFYILLIPGKPIFKIISSILHEIITITIRITIMLLPSILLDTKYILLGILMYLVTFSACLFLKLQNLIGVLLLPKEKTEPPILYTIFIMFIVAIPIVLATVTFSISSNIYFAVLVALVVLITYILTVALLCDTLFKKIQY